ncbi:hypothetical protein GQR58_007119 [Nymphon striatum]|nr:hypothetical protein GQR58_007119 [Nymphon striatum]
MSQTQPFQFEPKYATDEEGEESLSSSQSNSKDDEKASRIGEQSWCESQMWPKKEQTRRNNIKYLQSRERSSLSLRSLTEIHTKIVHLSYLLFRHLRYLTEMKKVILLLPRLLHILARTGRVVFGTFS